ncbi:acyl carrier protein [Streptomyces chiangmaiensis]|uniref:Acyl carrier protein n=1 Tax=Streptomyces chiangmaiensis TaxID=766497 RepID=A0ABU7FKI9_9ACTN|nr:acyl carrier protein [Streptomyces chiangmaiensis]MED7824625.1 acyl carrier protein [Streptomyces chiangmaiensis]
MEHTTPDAGTADLYGRAVATIADSLAKSMQVDAATIGENSRLFDELGLDSTTVLELLMTIEEELGMEFETDLLEQHHLETVGALAVFVQEQADEQADEQAGV